MFGISPGSRKKRLNKIQKSSGRRGNHHKRATEPPRGPQDGPKSAPRRRPTTADDELFPFQDRVQADLAPKRSQEASGRPFWTSRGPKTSPRAPFWHRFSKPPEAHFSRRWRNTCPTSSSTPGPAECAKRWNKIRRLHCVERCLVSQPRGPWAARVF